MILAEALNLGLGYPVAMCMPKSMIEDMIATRQLMSGMYDRIFTDPQDIEDDFRKTFSYK